MGDALYGMASFLPAIRKYSVAIETAFGDTIPYANLATPQCIA